MYKSEVLIHLNNSSYGSSRSVSAGSQEQECNNIGAFELIPNVEYDINSTEHRNEVFLDANNKTVAEHIVLNYNSFSSSNSSIFRDSQLRSTSNSMDGNINIDNPDLRGLFCHILTKLEVLEAELNLEKEHFKSMKNEYNSKLNKLKNSLYDEIEYLYDDIYEMDVRLVQVEQYSRRESVIISGIPDSVSKRDLEPTVIDILKRIGLDRLSSFEISACHRLFKDRNDKYPARTIIKFTNRKLAEFCFYHKERLIEVSRNLYLNLRFYESLCKTNEKILKLCKQLYDSEFLEEYYVINGSIRIKTFDYYRHIKIKHPEQLYEKFKDYFDYDDLYLT